MIQPALIRKAMRDYFPLWGGLLLLTTGFVVLYMVAVNTVAIQKSEEFIKLPFVRRLMTVMLGTDPLDYMNPTVVAAFGFTHPMVWTLLVVFALTMSTGLLAGEMDRGTMDVLGALPVSRGAIYASSGVTLLLMGLPLCWGVWVGTFIGRSLISVEGPRMDQLVRVTWHLYAVFILIASFSLAISAMSSRRGPAIAASFFIVFYAFVLNVLRALWPALDVLAWSDFLTYYQAILIIRDDVYRWGDLAVLLGVSAVWWAIGLTVFRRRDIPAR